MEQKIKDNIVIATLSTTMSASAALIPVLSSIAKAFPNYAHLVHLLVTIPPLMIMISSLIVNPLLRFFSCKKITILGLCLVTISGTYPYFSNSFILLIISRIIMGLGLGLIVTISSSLPARYFCFGKDRDRATGLQSAFSSLGGVLFSFLSGFIANYYWKGVFLVQLLNLLPLIVIFLLMSPHLDRNLDGCLIEDHEDKKVYKSGSRKIFVKEAFLITFIAFICVVLNITFPLNLSIYVDVKNIGTTNLTGLIASINAFIGFLIGILFHRVNKILKQRTLSASLFLVSMSFFILSNALHPFTFLVGSTLFGIGTSLIYPSFLTKIYNIIPDEDIIPAIAMYTIATNVAQFVSPFIINPISNILGSGIEHKFIFAAISTALIGTLMLFNSKDYSATSTH